MRKSLTKSEIIRRKPEIQHVFKAGVSQSVRGMKLIVSRNSLDYGRIIVIPVKHYGTAVERNRIRRCIKEIWRTHKDVLVSGYDFAFVMYPGNAYDHSQLTQLLLSLCKKAGVLLSSPSSTQ